MKTQFLIIINIIIIAAILGFIYYKNRNVQTPAEQPQIQTQTNTRINSEGAVMVEITPLDLSENSDLWKFEISLNTHSVELDRDMVKSAFIRDDKGFEYLPLSWDGDPAGGHHISGTLTFRRIEPYPKSIDIILKDIDETPEKTFSWDL